MSLKTFRYYASLGINFIQRLPFSAIVAVSEIVLRFWPKDVINDVAVIDPRPDTRAKFAKDISAALALIEKGDPRRNARLKQEVRAIVNIPVAGGAEYSRFLKTSRIDIRYFSDIDDRDTAAALLACRLISHATFGYICSRRLVVERHYARVMKLCFKEEARFARNLGLELGEDWGWFGSEPLPATDEQRREWAKQQRQIMSASAKKR